MTKLIDTHEIAAFAQVDLPGWIEVPDWVRYITVDADRDIVGFSQTPQPHRSPASPRWSRYCCPGGRGYVYRIHTEYAGRRLLPDWDQWCWEVPA